jgi:hypothetical protein
LTCVYSTSVIIFKPNLPCRFQVPATFSFLDVHPDKGLNEDVVELACKLLLFIRLGCSALNNFGQMQEEVNTYFALMWIPSFAVDPPLAWRRRLALVCHFVIQGHMTNLRTIPHVFRKLWWMLPSSTI